VEEVSTDRRWKLTGRASDDVTLQEGREIPSTSPTFWAVNCLYV
jgi:hypothetical protein